VGDKREGAVQHLQAGTPIGLTPDVRGCPYGFDNRSAEFNDHYQDVLATLRADSPVAALPEASWYFASRYADVYRILHDYQTFSSASGVATDPGGQLLPLIDTDPPEHTGWRQILNRWFTRPRMRAHEAGIRAIAEELVQSAIEAGQTDLVPAYASRLPADVFFTLILGLSRDDAEACARWVQQGVFATSHEESAAGYAALARFIAPLVTQLRALPPEDTLLSTLVHAEVAGREISDQQGVLLITLLILAGLETTAGTLSGALLHLAAHPQWLTALRTGQCPTESFVEECLRMFAPTTGLRRTATCPVDVAGKRLEPGDSIIVSYASANFDESEFDAPGTFNPARSPNRHVAFGAGIHRCLGSNLARIVLAVGIDVFAQQVGSVEVTGDLRYHSTPTRGLLTLPVRLAR
jgi:cytochrome P450